MAKYVIECSNCGKYAQASSGLFGFIGGTRTVNCACGHVINVRAEKLSSRECPHCGNQVVFDQSKGAKAKCPVCGEPINTFAEQDKTVAFSCAQCGIRLNTSKGVKEYRCPVCDHRNDVAERMKVEEVRRDGLASIIKYEGNADTLVWKHPIEDFNLGSQLIVHESQEAIFFRDGQALDLFAAGRYTLETQQLPLLEKFYRLPTDTEGTFHSEVYFFNLTHQMAIKWGTPDKVTLQDPLTQALISIGARGTLNFKIANSRKLLLKLVGTGSKLTRQNLMEDGESHIYDHFRGLIQMTVSTHLAEIITREKLDVLLLDQQKLRLSAALLDAIQSSFEAYGLVVTEFLVMGIVLPQPGDLGYEALQTMLQMRQKHLTLMSIETKNELDLAELEAQKRLEIRIQENVAEVEQARRSAVIQKGETAIVEAQYETQAERVRMQLELDRKRMTAQAEAEEMQLKGFNQRDVMQTEVQKEYARSLGQMGANGGGGALGDLAGLGVTLGAMGGVMGMAREAVSPMTVPPAAPATGWSCACGAKNVQSRFCPECGSRKPEAPAAWDCPNCGTRGITARFCGECGSPKPEAPAAWDCPNCGTRGITAKFCGECGHKKD